MDPKHSSIACQLVIDHMMFTKPVVSFICFRLIMNDGRTDYLTAMFAYKNGIEFEHTTLVNFSPDDYKTYVDRMVMSANCKIVERMRVCTSGQLQFIIDRLRDAGVKFESISIAI